MEALILSCGTGGGHNAAGAAICEELTRRGHHAQMLNPYTLKSQRLADNIDQTYVKIAQRAPGMFGFAYQLGDLYRRLPWRSPVYLVNRKMAPVLARYLADHPADVIIMPHLYPAEIITAMREQGFNTPPSIFVATDYSCIPFTEETQCDAYVIAAKELTQDYLRRFPAVRQRTCAFSRRTASVSMQTEKTAGANVHSSAVRGRVQTAHCQCACRNGYLSFGRAAGCETHRAAGELRTIILPAGIPGGFLTDRGRKSARTR